MWISGSVRVPDRPCEDTDVGHCGLLGPSSDLCLPYPIDEDIGVDLVFETQCYDFCGVSSGNIEIEKTESDQNWGRSGEWRGCGADASML